MSLDNLFSKEEQALEKARAVLHNAGAGAPQLRQALTDMDKAYSRLLKQSRRLIILSDKQQEDLRRLIQENECYLERLEALSRTDSLTQVPNRRYFDEFLQEEWARAKRACTPLSMLLLDLDRFKEYNDHHGHGQGDICLQRIALALFEVAKRSSDFFARYGGEEFACILPETDLDGAQTVAQRMLRAVADLALPHGFSDVAPHVTISIGLVTMRMVKGESPGELLRAADTQLYEAKRLGRDRHAGIAI